MDRYLLVISNKVSNSINATALATCSRNPLSQSSLSTSAASSAHVGFESCIFLCPDIPLAGAAAVTYIFPCPYRYLWQACPCPRLRLALADALAAVTVAAVELSMSVPLSSPSMPLSSPLCLPLLMLLSVLPDAIATA